MKTTNRHTLKILRSGDPKTQFGHWEPEEILIRIGPPRRLLSSSSKIQKSEGVGVLSRVLYLTPGIFCPAATKGCRAACLGHTSGRMHFQTHANARDARAALYVTDPVLFMKRLRAELTLLETDALQAGLTPAVRLNGSSDLAWERRHPQLFVDFPGIQFYDYTKILARSLNFLDCTFPQNYQLTYSVDARTRRHAKDLLRRGGNVAAVFAPELPHMWWEAPVIDGDLHDARFLDREGVVVGLRAKGLARVDTTDFVVRLCPNCGPSASQLTLTFETVDTHRRTLHECRLCGFELPAKWKATQDRTLQRQIKSKAA